jgi:hypothetical protein
VELKISKWRIWISKKDQISRYPGKKVTNITLMTMIMTVKLGMMRRAMGLGMEVGVRAVGGGSIGGVGLGLLPRGWYVGTRRTAPGMMRAGRDLISCHASL